MGAAFSYGLQFGEDQAAKQQARKQGLSDTELETNIGDANDNINGFRAKLSQYAPGSTEHEQAKQGLTQALQARTQLFHPANNPTAMSKFGHMLLDHMPGKQPTAQPIPVNAPTVSATPAMQLPAQMPATNGTGANSFTLPAGAGPTLPQGSSTTVQGPQTPQQLKAQAEANLIASSAPTPLPSALTSDETHAAERVKAGLDPKAVAPKAGTGAFFNPKDVTYLTAPDGSQHAFRMTEEGYVPYSGAEGMAPPVKAAPHSNAALQTFLRTEYGENPTGAEMEEGIRRFKQLQTPDTTSTHQSLVYDQNNQGHVFTGTSTSHKSFGGSHASAGSSAPVSASKQGKPSSGGSKSRSPIGPAIEGFGKASPQSNAAFKAQDTAEAAYNDVKQASADPTPVGDQGIILAWLRGRVNRVTQTEINQVNNLGDAKMKLEGHIARLVSGKMTNQQRAWFLKSAKANYEGAKTVANKYRTPGAMKDAAQANTPSKQMSDDEFLMNLGGK